LAVPVAAVAVQAGPENWVAIGTTGIRVANLQRSGDLVYFVENVRMDSKSGGMTSDVVMDCEHRLTYVKKGDGHLSGGDSIEPNSIEDWELKYVCANAP
jgi:hypothetical protein